MDRRIPLLDHLKQKYPDGRPGMRVHPVYCPNCGGRIWILEDYNNYCEHCGASLTGHFYNLRVEKKYPDWEGRMFSKEVIKLTKPAYQAIQKIARKVGEECPECKGTGRIWWANYLNQSDCTSCNGTGKISQQEMIKQAKESIAKKEQGKYQLVYKKDRRTIVAEPRGWKWEPNPKDICFDKAGNELIVTGINRRKPWIIEVAEVHEDGIDMDGKIVCPDELTPFLHWEKIERILTSLDYELIIVGTDYYADFACGIQRGDKEIISSIVAPDLQEAAMKAVIELAKGGS